MAAPRSALSVAFVATTAAALPSLLAFNLAPSPTFLNQALAFALWAGFAAIALPVLALATALPLLAALGLVSLATAASQMQSLPATLALSTLGSLMAAAVLVAAGSGTRSDGQREEVFAAFCWGWVLTGAMNVGLAVVQVFWPDLPNGDWIAHSGLPGRAVGNLRQPNHLSSLLLWGCIAAIALREMGRLPRKAVAALGAAFVFAVVLTASRTGLVSVLLLALWGLTDRRLSRPSRLLLLAAPLVYAAAWLGMAQWASLSQHTFGGSERLAESDISSSRFAIWRDTLSLIAQHPWAGVGVGEFNFAWSLSVMPQRPTPFFDHTHNLPLQLAVELGLPLASAVMGLLLWALWRAARQAWAAQGEQSVAQRSAVLMVVMIGLHSMLEYPLWYSYFLLPAAWAFGFALRPAQPGAATAASTQGDDAEHRVSVPLLAAAMAVAACGVLSVVDYNRVVVIFSADPESPPLELRIARGQRSVLFGHHADYAAVTSGVFLRDPEHAFDRATHYLLDTRLMMAWARALAERGQLDAARHLAARLREFKKADSEDFFKDCPAQAQPAASAGANAGTPFQCELPTRAMTWRDFRPTGR